MSCEFYGHHAVPSMQILVAQGGNQCPFVIDAYAPCAMEMDGKAPDWETCPRNDGSLRATAIAAYEKREVRP